MSVYENASVGDEHRWDIRTHPSSPCRVRIGSADRTGPGRPIGDFRYRAWESYVGGSAYASDMTDMPTERRSPWRAVSRRAWSTILFVCGALLEAIGAANIPGLYAPEFEAGALVAAYWLVALMAWGTVFVRDPLASRSRHRGSCARARGVELSAAAHRAAPHDAPIRCATGRDARRHRRICRRRVDPPRCAHALGRRPRPHAERTFGVGAAGGASGCPLGGLASFTALARSRHSGDEQRRRAERERDG